jgi:hypothetical protein
MLRVIVALAALLLSGAASAQTQGGTFSQSAAAESSHIFKASAGNLFSIYATNGTATAGNLIVINSSTVPADGALVGCAAVAVTPCMLDCAPLASNGFASIMFLPGPPKPYTAAATPGIVAVLSSGAGCFVKTTGVITGFISADVQ